MSTLRLVLLVPFLFAFSGCADDGAGGPPAGPGCDGPYAPAWARGAACEGPAAGVPVVTVRIVDQTGAPAAAQTAWWSAAADAGFWGEGFSTAATCASGEPPCSEWVIQAPLPQRVVFTAARSTDPAANPGDCIDFASAATQLHIPDDRPQVVTLELPSTPTVCFEGDRRTPGPKAWQAPRAQDCATVPACVETHAVIRAVDAIDGAPVPTISANWYYPPDSERFDGEHPLRCLDALCTELALTEVPLAGTIYFTVSYVGPLHPEVATSWTGYGAMPFEWDPAAESPEFTLAVEILESAIGG